MPSSSEVRAARAYVEAYLKDRALYQGLDRMERRLQTFGRTATAWGRAVSAAGTKIAAAGAAMLAPLLLSVRQFAAAGDALDKMSARVGASVEFLSAMGHAADLSGTNLDQLAQAMFRARRRIGNATSETGPAVRALKELGQSAAVLAAMSPEDQFFALVDALESVDNEARRSQLAFEIFGDNWRQIAPLLNQGSDAIRATMGEAERLGDVLSTEDAAAAAEVTDAFARLTTTLKLLVVRLGAELAPAVQEAADWLRGAVPAVIDWIKRNGELIETTAEVAAGLLALGAAMKVVGTATAVLAANPLAVLFAGAAAAAVTLSGALRDVGEGLREVGDESRRALEEGDRRRAATLDQVARLEALSEKERLNNQEMEAARKIIAALRKDYGDLGIEVDETTGRIVGLTAGVRGLNAEMAGKLRDEAKAAFRESQRRVSEIIAEMNRPFRGYEAHFALIPGFVEGRLARLRGQFDAEMDRQAKIRARLRALKEGATDRAALTGAPSGGPAAPGPAEAPGESEEEKRLRATLDFGNRLERIRISAIANRHQREIASIKQRYDYEIATAKLTADELRHLEILRDTEVRAAKKRHAAEDAAEAKRAAETKKDRETALQDEIARLRIEATLKGKAKELALLKLEQDRAIREGVAAGVDPKLIREKYALMRAAMLAPGEAAEAKASAAGTFSAYAAARGLGGFDVQTRIARNTERTADNLQSLVTAARNAQLVFG